MNKVQPGLVIINTTLQYNSEQAAGTGIVISADGLVLTNNHVIEDSTSINATDVGNGRTYRAKVVGYDQTGDIAVIQLQGASGLKTAPVGNSALVKTGAPVVAMGNADGQSAIVPAAGQVTALHQTITASDEGGSITSETLHGMIEVNADIVSGDSGGPLANASGQVIGIDTAGNGEGFSAQQSTDGFAIPINTALSVASQITAGQASSVITIGYPPFMGVYIGGGSNASPQAQAQAQSGSFGGKLRRLRRQQPELLHQQPQPGRAQHHRSGQLGHPDHRRHLRRPGPGRGPERRVGHHRGERPGHRRPG